MNMRDTIAEIICDDVDGHMDRGENWNGKKTADAIIAALPDMIPDYDAQQARITELEAALGEFARFASRKDKNGASVPFGQSKLHAARAALKGEKT